MFYFIVDANGNPAQTVATRIKPGGRSDLAPVRSSLTQLEVDQAKTGYSRTTQKLEGLRSGPAAITVTALQQDQELNHARPHWRQWFWTGVPYVPAHQRGLTSTGQVLCRNHADVPPCRDEA